MALEQLKSLLEQMQKEALISVADAQEVLNQATEFEKRRSEIEARYHGQVVLITGGEIFTASRFEEAIRVAHQHFPTSRFYAEVLTEKGHL